MMASSVADLERSWCSDSDQVKNGVRRSAFRALDCLLGKFPHIGFACNDVDRDEFAFMIGFQAGLVAFLIELFPGLRDLVGGV